MAQPSALRAGPGKLNDNGDTMEQTKLHFTDGKSDKVYQAAIEPKDDGYLVTFSYGRRGGKMTTGTKTKSPVSLEEAKVIYSKLIKEKMAKGYVVPTKWQHRVTVSHCQFYIEPKYRLDTLCDDTYFDLEFAQGFQSFPRHAVIHCDDVWEITIDSELTDTVPSLEGAVQAACMPIEVVDDHGLFLRSVDDVAEEEGEENGESDDEEGDEFDEDSGDVPNQIDLPRGQYDMLVRIYATEGWYDDEDDNENKDEDGDGDEEEDEELNPRCKASLTFLPRGTIGPKCYLRDGFDPPGKLIIRTADGGKEEYPA